MILAFDLIVCFTFLKPLNCKFFLNLELVISFFIDLYKVSESKFLSTKE